MPSFVLRALAVAAALSAAASAAGADLQRGEMLYSARCVGCHETSVHRRESRAAVTPNSLKAQVRRWDAFMGGAWRDEEVNDVAAYLNRLYYQMPCAPDLCPDQRSALKRTERLAAR